MAPHRADPRVSDGGMTLVDEFRAKLTGGRIGVTGGRPKLDDDVIFMRRGEELIPLAAAPYEAEAVLQKLLDEYPQLLAGYQMDRGNPRRFLLVKREAPIADHDGGGGRWSIDHLFLDQDAVPTLVEVKRSSDTRIRREVVGQILDYAANIVRHWDVGDLLHLFEVTCSERKPKPVDPSDVLSKIIGADADEARFWEAAERNLRAGPLRLVFVADVIPDELRTIIEFLHYRMGDTEVYGVEVRRYGLGSDECFVPRLVAAGAAEAGKLVPTSLDDKLSAAPEAVRTTADRLRTLADELGLTVVSAPASLQLRDHLGTVVGLYPTFEHVGFHTDPLSKAGWEEAVDSLRTRLAAIAGHPVGEKEPSVKCERVAAWGPFVTTIEEYVRVRTEVTT